MFESPLESVADDIFMMVPEVVKMISAILASHGENLTTVVSGAQPNLICGPPGTDPVSTACATSFGTFQAALVPAATDGFTKLLHGAQVLVPSVDHATSTDQSNGGQIQQNSVPI